MAGPISDSRFAGPIGSTCPKCDAVHDPTKCQGHVDEAKRVAYAQGGRAARAKAKGELRQCKQWPRRGTTVCGDHGGSAPQVEQVAAARIAVADARQTMLTYGVKVDTDPVEALLDEVRWTAGHVAWLRSKVQATDEADLIWGTTEKVDKQSSEFPGTDTTEAAKPSVWLVLFWQERKHLVDACKACHGFGIAERQVRLAEQQGEMMVGVIQAILTDLRLSPEQQALVPDVVPRHLRSVA